MTGERSRSISSACRKSPTPRPPPTRRRPISSATQMLMERHLLSQRNSSSAGPQAETARRQLDVARNTAEQQYQSLLAARARLALARKALADTVGPGAV